MTKRIICLLLLLGSTMEPQTRKSLVDEHRSGTTHTILAVDSDDYVYYSHNPASDNARRDGLLGIRILKSGTLEIGSQLLHKRVATAARRRTLPSGDILHFVINWGFEGDLGTIFASMVVFRESRIGKVDKILEEFIGVAVTKFELGDFNQDGEEEVIVIGREGKHYNLKLFTIQSAGTVSKTQDVTGEEVTTIADRWPDKDALIVTVDNAGVDSRGRICSLSKSYPFGGTSQKAASRRLTK